jgi:hypothetical protein
MQASSGSFIANFVSKIVENAGAVAGANDYAGAFYGM